jgi:hypothetical protein
MLNWLSTEISLPYLIITYSQGGSVVTGQDDRETGVRYATATKYFMFYVTFRPALGPTQLGLFPPGGGGVLRQTRKAGHPPPSTAVVKNHTTTPPLPIHLHGKVLN